MSNDKNKKPPEEAAANNLYANIMLNYFNAAPPMHMDGTPVEDCPWEKEVKKALDSANPIEAFERLTDEDEHIDIPEDATEWRALIDKIGSNPIFKELPFVAQQELQEQAAESLEEAKDALQVLEEFGERDKADRADVERQMLKQARKVLIDNTRLTVSTSTETKDGDAFLYRNLQEDPSSVAVVEGMMKGLITRAARAAAIPLAGYVSMGGQLLPRFTDKDKRKKQAATLKDTTAAVDAETVAAMILEAIPQTFGYFKEHAPERAAALETYAREEAVKAFAPLVEYVARIAEPVEEEAPAALQTVPILKRIDGTDKLTQAIFAGKVGRNYVNVAMETAGSAKEVTSAICLLDYNGFTLPNGQPLVLTPFLYEVYNAVCSIRAAGNRFTTYNMIYKVMTGKTGRGKSKEVRLNAEKKEQLRKALQILRVGVSTDIHEEVDAGYIKGEKLKGTRFEKLKNAKKRPAYIDDVLLDTRVIGNVEIDGHMMDEVIEIKDEPILYSYSKMRGQVSTYPLEVLNAPIRNTADNMAVRGILIRWILMGDKKKDFYKLNYEKIFEAVGISAADKSSGTNKRRTQIRKCVDDCLIYWKKIKFIHNYEVTRRGMKYLSISVTTPEQIEEWKGKQHKRKAH